MGNFKNMFLPLLLAVTIFFSRVAVAQEEAAREGPAPSPNITLTEGDLNEGTFSTPASQNGRSKVKVKRSGGVYPQTAPPSSTTYNPKGSSKANAGKKVVRPSTPAPNKNTSTLDKDNQSKTSTSKWGSSGSRDNQSSISPNAKGASSDLPAKPVIGPAKKMRLLVGGKTYNVSARSTGIQDEYLVLTNDPAWSSICAQFSGTCRWEEKKGRLYVTSNGKEYSLSRGQMDMPKSVGGRSLDVPLQTVDGKDFFPISCLEDFLGVRVTASRDGTQGWIEPLISSVRLEGDSRNPRLLITSTSPLTYRTFRLAGPNRYVIDIPGGVLNTTSLNVNHPELGDIRLGQFTLGPAVSRIVVPTTLPVKITAPPQAAAKELAFSLQLPKTQVVQNYKLEKIQDVKVENVEQGTYKGRRVVLCFTGPVKYEWSRLLGERDRFVVDLSQVALAEKSWETNINAPCVKAVRVSQYRNSPQPVARVVLDLGKSAQVTVSSGSLANSLALTVIDKVINPNVAMLKGYGATSVMNSAQGAISGGRTVCIDAGHGGSDAGCVYRSTGLMEKEVTLDICLQLADILTSQGWRVLLTRDNDRDVTWAGSSNTEELSGRVRVANEGGADVFVSVHCNASVNASAEGTSLHVYKRSDRVLAEEMHHFLTDATGRYDRGIAQDRFFVLVHSSMPAVLIETAFLSNGNEAQLLSDPQYRLHVAQGLAEGLNAYASKYLLK